MFLGPVYMESLTRVNPPPGRPGSIPPTHLILRFLCQHKVRLYRPGSTLSRVNPPTARWVDPFARVKRWVDLHINARSESTRVENTSPSPPGMTHKLGVNLTTKLFMLESKDMWDELKEEKCLWFIIINSSDVSFMTPSWRLHSLEYTHFPRHGRRKLLCEKVVRRRGEQRNVAHHHERNISHINTEFSDPGQPWGGLTRVKLSI